MLHIDKNGYIIDNNVKLEISLPIQKNLMTEISGIIIHQTGGSTAQSAFNSYKAGASGAHFLIDKDRTIDQTASLSYQTWHVGKLEARCLVNMTCTPSELELLRKFNPTGEHRREVIKKVLNRYPVNQDSIGVELVGDALPKTVPEEKRIYETATKEQNASLKWLIGKLRLAYRIPLTEVFRHPVVSRKNLLKQQQPTGNRRMKPIIKYPLLGLMISSCLLADPDSGVDPGVYPLDVGKIMDIEISKSGLTSTAVEASQYDSGASPLFAQPEMGSVRCRVHKMRRRPWPSAARVRSASVPARTLRGTRTPAMTGCRVAWPGLSSPPALTRRTLTKGSALRLRGGRRTPLVAYAPSLSCAPP